MKTIPLVLFIGLVFRASFCHGAEDLFAHRAPIDLAKAAGTSRLLLVGDDHTQPAIKRFLANELPLLQRVGFSHLAIEMLPTDFQDDLDAWTPESQERIQRHLAMAWGEKGRGVVESLFTLVQKAKGQGMEVPALDPPDTWSWNRIRTPTATFCLLWCIEGCAKRPCRP